MIDNKKWLQKSELNKIKAECDNECSNPCADEMHWCEAQRVEYERERLPKYDKEEELLQSIPFYNALIKSRQVSSNHCPSSPATEQTSHHVHGHR